MTFSSQLVESEGYLVLLAPSTGPILLVQEEEGGLYESSDGILARVNDDGWTVESPGGPTSLFDRLGKELSRRDANGNTITFSYDSRGFLSEVKAFDGQALRFTYDAKGLLTSIQGPSGRQCEYRYDATGRLTEAKEADGWTTGFAYSEGGRLSAIDYPSGERVRFNYDGSGRVAERASSTGVTYTYSYAAATRVSRQDGFWSETSYDKRGFPEKYRESTGREQSWGWNEEGQLETRTFLDGSSASYRYDLQGRLLRQETSRGDVLEIAYDGDRFLPVRTNFNGTVTQFEYDPNGNLLSMTSPAGRKTTYTYDAHGRRQSVTNGEGSTTRFTYDSVGDLIRQINPDGGAISFEYDSDGRIVREEDPVGRVTSYSYQANGLLQSVTDPLGDALSYEYDAHGRITKEVRPQNTVQYHYDERGFPAGIDFPDQTQIRVSHDALGNPTQVVDRFGTITKNEYDPLGRLVSTILPTGMPIGMSYDSSGRLQTMGHDTNTYRLAMDPGARETRLTDPAGGVTRLRHDQMDQVVQRISPGGGREQRKYDPDGLLESVTLPMGDTWEFSYDRAGQPLEILFPTGVRQQLSYDKAGRLAGIRYPGGQSIAYSYDPSGLLLEMTNARGQRVQYGYDPGGRFISKKTPEEDWHYRYDSAGHLVQATNGKFTLRYTYNGFGQLVQTEYVEWGKTIQYSRDKLGRIESRIDPDGNRTSYAYDRFGQISRIAHTGGAVFDFEYSREGRLTGRRNPNGTSTEYLYDPAGRINSVQHRNASGDVISSRTYRYDFDGNRVESTDEQGRGDTFQYDQEQKLTGEKGPWGWRSYVYGPGGQRISVSGPSSNVPYLYDDRGMLIEAGEEKFGYDPDGNLITRTGREGATLYSYDGEGNLTGIELPDGKRIAYGYGPFRERIWREEDGRRTYYLLDGSDAIQELSANLEPKATYLFGGLDQPLMVSFSDGETAFFHQDILGSILAISDSNQQVVARYSYDAFGRVLKEEGEIRQPLRFTGRPFDALTGLQDLRLRFYDPEHGRFLSMDPLPGEIDDPMSLSPYLYVRNNPLSYPDPFGLDPFWVPTPNARDMYGYFARDIGAFPPIWLEPEYVITPSARTNPLEVMKRIDEHADWLQEKFGANTAAGFRKRAMERWRGMIAGGAVRNLPQGSRTVGNVTPPSTGSSGSVLDGRTALAGQRLTAGSALSSARQWIRRTASSALDAVRGTSRVSTWGNWGMAAGDLIGETFDVPTMSFTDDAFRNMTSSARSLFIASGVGAAGGAVATYAAPLLSGAVGGALATGGAVAGAGMLVYGAGNRTYAAMQEANRMERAWRSEAANQARAVNTEKIMSDRYLDDLNKLRAKSNELEALRPQIQGADAEIRSLELEIANKRNAVQAAHERLNGLAAQFRDADSKLRSETTPTGESRRDTRINALMNELQELKRKACEAAASVTGISDPAGKTRKLEEAKGYARGAAQKAEEISQLQGVPEPQGDSAETQEALRTMENTLLEMEESYSAIEADTRGIQERKDLIEGKWGPLERAWTLQAEILLNLNLRKNFSDPLGELAPLRESASRPLPPKEGLKELLQSAQDSFNQAKGLEDRGKRTVETARQFTNAAKNRLPSATSPGVSPAQDPALLVKEAQACVTEAERQASGTGSETGTGEATPRSTEEDGGFQSAGEGTTESSEEQTVSPDSFGPAGVGRTEEGSGVSLLSTDVMGQRPDFPTAEGEDETGGGFASAGAGQTAPGAVASAQPTSFQTTFTTTIAAGQPAAWHIFATGCRQYGHTGSVACSARYALNASVARCTSTPSIMSVEANFRAVPGSSWFIGITWP
ncbi:MAG: hypothetical protein HGA55_00890 [Methanoregulaceae archaeon]|nr:hypothetical protein [Methanoregulaceae archaeon]